MNRASTRNAVGIDERGVAARHKLRGVDGDRFIGSIVATIDE
jgi:hypothetical protein